MNPQDQEQQIHKNNMRKNAAERLIQESRHVELMMCNLVFMRELIDLNKTDDQILLNGREVDLSSEQLIGLYELIKNDFLDILPDISERILNHMECAARSEQSDLTDARDWIYNVICKLSFVQMLAEIPASETCVSLSYQAAIGLSGILRNIEGDLEAIHETLYSTGNDMASDLSSDAGSAKH
ncbi:hypothetical protein [Nitrosomonas sp. Nm58]|uniref:hypothetical protein n=1 Tax=Nitrosomonas sp. Nm58 TaxID=200126 RepID=UPI00089C9FD2|nr:hypothetical protein [Nitrosomonas sp. Nm58]SDZ15604.1 hypothetical protein SAMN05421754_10775 [Nitrosomonas sp. Nm58]